MATTPQRQSPMHASTKPGAGMASTVTAAAAQTGIENFLRLMQHELVTPLAKLAELAGQMDDLRNSGAAPGHDLQGQTFADLYATSLKSARIAQTLIDLGDVLVGKPLLTDERILVVDILREATTLVAEPRKREIRLEASQQELAPVYGSTYWLRLALQKLLTLLAHAAPAGTYLLIRQRQVGFHQIVSGDINFGRASASTMDLINKAPGNAKLDLGQAATVNALDLVLARAIIELHGGMLKTELDGKETLEKFTLTLPTGEPHALHQRGNCDDCPFVRQAEQFATDIGEMLNAQADQRLADKTRTRS